MIFQKWVLNKYLPKRRKGVLYLHNDNYAIVNSRKLYEDIMKDPQSLELIKDFETGLSISGLTPFEVYYNADLNFIVSENPDLEVSEEYEYIEFGLYVPEFSNKLVIFRNLQILLTRNVLLDRKGLVFASPFTVTNENTFKQFLVFYGAKEVSIEGNFNNLGIKNSYKVNEDFLVGFGAKVPITKILVECNVEG